MKRVIVAGAGASGMMAAIRAAESGAAVTLLEGGEKPGKKLLLTGNGRCNLTNRRMAEEECYRGSSLQFICGILEQFPVEETLRFFREIGLPVCERSGYVYPATNQAASVRAVLLLELGRLSVKIKCQEKVTGIRKENGLFKVRTDSWEYEADAVILACGSRAAPQTGSDGSGYEIAKALGHRLIKPLEALVPLTIKETWIRKLSGVRMQARLTLFCSRQKPGAAGLQSCGAYRAAGELQWTEYGVSGIPVFQVSRYAVRILQGGGSAQMVLDLFPFMEKEELSVYLKEHQSRRTLAELLVGILPAKAVAPILGQAGLSPASGAESLTDTKLGKLINAIKELPLTVGGCRSFDRAQVCSGGVDTAQLDNRTLESRIVPGLYFAGEILDVDGICGGYNLQWAWSSGTVAGRCGAREKP